MNKKIRNIGILGAGTMGTGIGLLFALKGYDVKLIFSCDADKLSNPLKRIEEALQNLWENGAVKEEKIKESLSKITVTESLEEAAEFSDIIFECIIEDLKTKQKFFALLDKLCPKETILATNTSVISITEIAEKAENKERIIGTHYWNPAYLIPLVEIIKTKYVSEETVEKTFSLMENIEKKPVIVNKDVPGFLANRMQHALFREALYIIEEGIADSKSVENAVKYSFGMRMGIMAPIEIMDMGGLDLTYSIHKYLFKHLNNSSNPSVILENKISEGKLGFKTGEGLLCWSEEKIFDEKKRLTRQLIEVSRALDMI